MGPWVTTRCTACGAKMQREGKAFVCPMKNEGPHDPAFVADVNRRLGGMMDRESHLAAIEAARAARQKTPCKRKSA